MADKSRYTIETVIKAGRVIQVIADSRGPIAQAEIARAAGINANQCFRLLVTLEELRWTRRVGDEWELDMGLATVWARYRSGLMAARDRVDRELADLEIQGEQ